MIVMYFHGRTFTEERVFVKSGKDKSPISLFKDSLTFQKVTLQGIQRMRGDKNSPVLLHTVKTAQKYIWSMIHTTRFESGKPEPGVEKRYARTGNAAA
ncbi:MAG: hypothetical protein WAU64_00845 [Methanoregula sp.]|uniref:hypothetical protein n=1 Tax=Methanoregula sp. TaxID=2052170 RepID=UPI003BAEAA97